MKCDRGNFAILLILSLTSSLADADIIFSQDFSALGSVPDYVNSTSPSSGQWNAITGATIHYGTLSFTRAGTGAPGFTRSTDLSPAPQSMIYRFQLSVSNTKSMAAAALTWQVGSGFSTSVAGVEDKTKVFSRFAVNLVDPQNGFTFRNLETGKDSTTVSTLAGGCNLTWVINRSGATIWYMAPNNTRQSVANNSWDLWADFHSVFDDVPATTSSQQITDLKFGFTGGSSTIAIDNVTIDNLEAVPESRKAGAGAALFLLLTVAARTYNKKLKCF